MKTPMQELIEQLKEERDGFLKLPPHSNIQERTENCFGSCIEIAERMLKKEKDVMCDFVEYCDEANRNYQETEESWCEDLTIDDMFDKRFNTKEK
jgi:hypothetical protein